jgi:hypothetical protein
LEPNLHSHRVIQITHLICSIDKKSFISVYILLFKIVNTIYIYNTCLINRV